MSEEKKQPSHDIMVVIGEGESARWIKIGAAWPNRDGKGYNLALDAVPVGGGRLVMRQFNGRATEDGSRPDAGQASTREAAPNPPAP